MSWRDSYEALCRGDDSVKMPPGFAFDDLVNLYELGVVRGRCIRQYCAATKRAERDVLHDFGLRGLLVRDPHQDKYRPRSARSVRLEAWLRDWKEVWYATRDLWCWPAYWKPYRRGLPQWAFIVAKTFWAAVRLP